MNRLFGSKPTGPKPTLNGAIKSIKEELKIRLAELEKGGRLLEAQRLEQRTRYDIEMLEELKEFLKNQAENAALFEVKDVDGVKGAH